MQEQLRERIFASTFSSVGLFLSSKTRFPASSCVKRALHCSAQRQKPIQPLICSALSIRRATPPKAALDCGGVLQLTSHNDTASQMFACVRRAIAVGRGLTVKNDEAANG